MTITNETEWAAARAGWSPEPINSMAAERQRTFDKMASGAVMYGVPSATGATAGIPGTWTPAGSAVPSSPALLAQSVPMKVTASPATPWTTGQYVQTDIAGAAGRASWTGTAWVSGAAP